VLTRLFPVLPYWEGTQVHVAYHSTFMFMSRVARLIVGPASTPSGVVRRDNGQEATYLPTCLTTSYLPTA
jgi:hypothetical protein